VERLLSQSEVAELLGIAPRSLEGMRLKGTGCRFVRVGRLVRYRPADVAEWLASRTAASTSDPGQQRDAAA